MNAIAVWCAIASLGQTPPQFAIDTTDSKPLVGAIRQMGADGSLTLTDRATVTGANLVSIRRVAQPLPAWPQSAQAILHNGDRLAGTPQELVGAVLHFRATGLRRVDQGKIESALRIPLSSIAFLWLRPPETLDRARHAVLFAETRANDQVALRNGDVLAGTLSSLDAKKGEVQIEIGAEHRTIALSQITVIALSTKLARIRKPMGAYSHVILADGSRLTASTVSIDDGAVAITTPFRETWQLPLAELAALDVYQGKAVYLSDLKPAKFNYRSYQGEEFGWAADRNLEGEPLRLKTLLGEQTFDKGVAVHGECTLSYALDGGYRRFEATVGLDARLGARGSVELRVLVDGKEQQVGDSKALTLEYWPRRLKVDVPGAKTLTLIVNWGDGGNVGDHVNWCDARLIP